MIEQLEPPLMTAFAPLADRFPGLALHAGPGDTTGPGPALRTWARDLRHTAPDPEAHASPQHAARTLLQSTGDPRTWRLVGADGPAELFAPDGRPLIRGEDWTVEPAADGALLRLRAASPGPPIAWLRGAAAHGLQTRGACRIRLSLIAAAARTSDADELTRAALARALPALLLLPPLEWSSFPAAPPPGPGVRVRIAGPRVTLDRQARRWIAADPGHAQVTTSLSLHGELELEVATRAPEPAGVIAEVIGQFAGAAISLAAAVRP